MVSVHSPIPISSAAGIENIATPTPNQPICVKPRIAEERYEPLLPKVRRHNRSMFKPVLEPIKASTPQYADRITPPIRQAHTKPDRSKPLPSFAPTLILAEKNVNPSITKNICQKPLRADSGTASSE